MQEIILLYSNSNLMPSWHMMHSQYFLVEGSKKNRQQLTCTSSNLLSSWHMMHSQYFLVEGSKQNRQQLTCTSSNLLSSWHMMHSQYFLVEGSKQNRRQLKLALTQTYCPLDTWCIHSTFLGKSILQVPDTGTSQYWWMLEHFWCTSIAWKCDIHVL